MDTYAYTREYLARKHIEDLKGFDWFGSWKSKTSKYWLYVKEFKSIFSS